MQRFRDLMGLLNENSQRRHDGDTFSEEHRGGTKNSRRGIMNHRHAADSEEGHNNGATPYMYAAMLALRDRDFGAAERCIDAGRRVLAPALGSMLDEAYSRAYGEKWSRAAGRRSDRGGRREASSVLCLRAHPPPSPFPSSPLPRRAPLQPFP